MDFKSALSKICKDFNKEIIFERRVISILDDYGAFKDKPYYKLFYKAALSSGSLIDLISQNGNIRDKAIYTFLSSAGLDEYKVKVFISIIFECYHRVPLTSVSKQTGIEKQSVDNRVSTNDGTSKKSAQAPLTQSGDNIIFMGKGLGCELSEMADHLRNRGFIHSGFSYDGTRMNFKGSFLGVVDTVISIWTTPITNLVWRIDVLIKQSLQTIKEIYQRKYPINSFNTCQLSRGEIVLKEASNKCAIIEYTDSKTFNLRQREREDLGNKTREQIERERQRIINQSNINDI